MISYGVSLPGLFRQAADYVDKILRGERPDDLPVQRPTKFELTVNLRAAEALGITIPPMRLATADRVIEQNTMSAFGPYRPTVGSSG